MAHTVHGACFKIVSQETSILMMMLSTMAVRCITARGDYPRQERGSWVYAAVTRATTHDHSLCQARSMGRWLVLVGISWVLVGASCGSDGVSWGAALRAGQGSQNGPGDPVRSKIEYYSNQNGPGGVTLLERECGACVGYVPVRIPKWIPKAAITHSYLSSKEGHVNGLHYSPGTHQQDRSCAMLGAPGPRPP